MKKIKEFSHFSKNSCFSVAAGHRIFRQFLGLTAHYEEARTPLARKMSPKALIFQRSSDAQIEGFPVVGFMPPRQRSSASKCLSGPQMGSPHSSLQSEN
jgi:hypothetical protein